MFRPEFLNRLDEIIVFRRLELDHILSIEDIYISEINTRLLDRDLRIELSPEAREFIGKKGHSDNSGARTLRRIVERNLEDPLAEELLRGTVSEGQVITVKMEDDKLTFSTEDWKPTGTN